MLLNVIGTTEEGALDALYQREHFPIGTRARLAYENMTNEPGVQEYTFDLIFPHGRPVWSMEHPYEAVPVPITDCSSVILTIAVAGYSAMHADTHKRGMEIADRAMFWRTFDRGGGTYEAAHNYEGCMTGGRR
jgi:hypothetical protein